jgi:hypothetical protein
MKEEEEEFAKAAWAEEEEEEEWEAPRPGLRPASRFIIGGGKWRPLCLCDVWRDGWLVCELGTVGAKRREEAGHACFSGCAVGLCGALGRGNDGVR